MIDEHSLPRHKASLSITHNDHKDCYHTAAEQFKEWDENDHCPSMRDDDWRERMIETDEIWIIHWYPDTPVGFYSVAAPTLQEAVEYAKEVQDRIDATGSTYSPTDPNVRANELPIEPLARLLDGSPPVDMAMEDLASEFHNMLNGATTRSAKDQLWNEFAEYRQRAVLSGKTNFKFAKGTTVIEISGVQQRCVYVQLGELAEMDYVLFLYLMYDKRGAGFEDVYKYKVKV